MIGYMLILDLKGIYCLLDKNQPDAKYIGQTRVSFRARMAQHRNDVTSSKSDEHISGIAKQARHNSNADIDWDNPKIIATFNDKNKAKLQHNLLIGESLNIRKYQTSTGSGLNDPQLCVRSNAWDPILSITKDNGILS